MPKKNKELEAEGTPVQESAEANAVEAKTGENAEVLEAVETSKNDPIEARAEDAVEEKSIVTGIAETIGAAVGSFAATVSEGISAVVSAATGDSTIADEPATTEKDKSQHNKRAERIGIVQSDKMTKTVTVRIERQVKHPIYRKYIKRRKNFMAHDEQGAAVGDKVRIVETRQLSAKKRWRVVEIIQKAVK